MEIIWEELMTGMPDARQIARVIIRLMAAMLVGAVIGIQRERTGKPAGLRTHMLVTLGSTLFVLVPLEAGMALADLSRVIQGLATGIGFIGGGAILKLSREHDIQGLTTASGIWMTAAIGVAVGLGRLGVALLSAVLTWIILAVIGKVEHLLSVEREATDENAES